MILPDEDELMITSYKPHQGHRKNIKSFQRRLLVTHQNDGLTADISIVTILSEDTEV